MNIYDIFTDQLLAFLHFQKSAYYAGIKNVNGSPCIPTRLINTKDEFKVALTRYINMYYFYYVNVFVMFKNDL